MVHHVEKQAWLHARKGPKTLNQDSDDDEGAYEEMSTPTSVVRPVPRQPPLTKEPPRMPHAFPGILLYFPGLLLIYKPIT